MALSTTVVALYGEECPLPCSIIWRCLGAPKLTPTGIGAASTMSTQSTGANGSSLPPLRRSQARHLPGVMLKGFRPYPTRADHHGLAPKLANSPSSRAPASLAASMSSVARTRAIQDDGMSAASGRRRWSSRVDAAHAGCPARSRGRRRLERILSGPPIRRVPFV